MKYTILQVRKFKGKPIVVLEVAPDGGPLSHEGVSLNASRFLPCRDHPTTNRRGLSLTRRLSKDPAIGRALNFVQGMYARSAGATAPPDVPQEIYPIMVDVGPAENMPWEALWSVIHKRPLSLFSNWPVVRRAQMASPVGHFDILWEPELRILAVLAAARIDATPEWRALKAAIENHGDWVRVKVLAAQKELVDEITAAALPNVRVEVASGKDAILSAIRVFRPHILHCFAHGEPGTNPSLLVATPSTWQSGQSQTAIEFSEFDELGASRTLWLTTINACGSAGGQWNAGSFARSVVARGMPVVIGMRDLLPPHVSHLFAERFFSALLARLRAYGGRSPDEPVTAEGVREQLFRSLHRARCGIHESEDHQVADCMLPVMYLNEHFRFIPAATEQPDLLNASLSTPPLTQKDEPPRGSRKVLGVKQRKELRRRLLQLAILEQNLEELIALGTPVKLLRPLQHRARELRKQVKLMQGLAES